MRVSFEWLSDFVDLSGISPREAAELLTMHGIEISAVHEVDLSRILVGRVLAQEPHPRSRSPLWVHQVDLGDRVEQIIAGAPNATPGSLVPVALPGVVVPSGKAVREAFNVGGVPGTGMLCSAAELEMGDDHSGILLLDEGQPGQSLAELFPPDAVLEAEVLSNRPDCLGHMGVARELAAAARREMKRDFMPLFTGGVEPPGGELVDVVIEEPELCRRYIGAPVTGVSVGPSPAWMRRRLRAAGVRPINNVVDVTNYVLLEYGQPLHAFDLSRLAGPRVRVRRAWPGEKIRCLDGEERTLQPDMLVIADEERAVAVAGVIGGEDTAVTDATTDVLLEAATFDGPSVRATSQALGLRTEASARFEKSLSPELALAGARRAAALLAEVAGGAVHREWPDRYPRPQEPVMVRMNPARVDAMLGLHVPLEESEAILRRLGFHVRVAEDGAWEVLPPVFRLDVSIPEDVVEEIGRIHGYDKVPASLPGARQHRWYVNPPGRPLDRLRAVLAGAGLQEVVTPALVSARLQERLGVDARALRCVNPLNDEMDALRTTLIPSLLDVAARNRSQGRGQTALFEWAHVYLAVPGRELPDEPLTLGAVVTAGAEPDDGREALLFLKSVLDAGAGALGTPAPVYSEAASALFHPGRCAAVSIGTSKIGHVGELHPTVMETLDLGGRAVALEVDLDAMTAQARPWRARPLPRFPAAERDLSVSVSRSAAAADLLAAIEAEGAGILERAQAFDEYHGSQAGEGMKSLAFSITFRSPERTLTDEEVDRVMAQITARLEREHGAQVRR